jgi:hypothetical protein
LSPPFGGQPLLSCPLALLLLLQLGAVLVLHARRLLLLQLGAVLVLHARPLLLLLLLLVGLSAG